MTPHPHWNFSQKHKPSKFGSVFYQLANKKHLVKHPTWYIDGWDLSVIATSHSPSRFSCSGKKFVKELSVLSGNKCADAFETNSIVNDSIVK